jgi:hypothetical protein
MPALSFFYGARSNGLDIAPHATCENMKESGVQVPR